MAQNKKNYNKFFYIFIITHLILWILVPYSTNNNLPLDTIEALAWGSNLEWGFSKHPPLSALFPEIIYQIFGTQDWAYYLLSQIFVITSFIFVFKLSYEILKNKKLAFISVLLLEAIYFYNFTTPEFNVNVCQLPFWSLTVYFTWKIYNSKNIDFLDTVFLGIFAAGGILSKYLFLYLLVSIDILFIYLIYVRKDRKFDLKYLVSLEVFILLLLPHIIWLIQNDYITLTYALSRTGLEQSFLIDHIKFPIIFIFKQLGILLPFFFLAILIIKKIKFKINLKDKKLLFLISINLIPIILMFLTSLFTGSKIRTMWMTPFYLFFGLLIIYIFKNQINFKNLKNFYRAFVFLFLFSPFLYAYISITKIDKRTDYPGKEIASKVQKKWDKQFDTEINVVLGDEWKAGNLSYHLKSRPSWGGKIEKDKLDYLNNFICIDEICVGNK